MANAAKVKADSFLSRLVDIDAGSSTSPVYLAVQPEIEKLASVYMSLPSSGNPLASDDPETALADLVGFKTVGDLQDIVDSANAVTQAFNVYFGASIKSFAALVGEDSITASSLTKVYETRRGDEVTEQNKNLTDSTDFQRRLVEAATKLSIGLTAPTPVVDKPRKAKFNPLSFLYVPVAGSGPEIDHTQTYDWQTPAVFDPKSDDAKLFERIYTWLFGPKKLDPAVVLQSLEQTYNVSGDQLKELFGRLYDVTNRQIDQSRKILTYIEKDYKMYQGCMDAGLELQAMIVEIGKFFGFTVGKGSSKKPTK